jgi:hypothetical protein
MKATIKQFTGTNVFNEIQLPTAANMNVTLLWNIELCRLIAVAECFRGTYCL